MNKKGIVDHFQIQQNIYNILNNLFCYVQMK